MATTQEQERFLEAVADDTQPVIYVHSGLTHSVYVTRLSKLNPYKFEGREEPVYQLRMVETASAATGASAEEQFLMECANDLTPVIYHDRHGERHRVIITKAIQTQPYKFEGRYQPVWQLVMVDAWAGFEIQDADAAKIATAAAASLYRQVAYWDGNSRWNFAQWG